jgi:hypothetical protein
MAATMVSSRTVSSRAVGREGEARWLATADGERPRLSQGCASQPKLLVGRHGQGVDAQHDVGRAYRINSQT